MVCKTGEAAAWPVCGGAGALRGDGVLGLAGRRCDVGMGCRRGHGHLRRVRRSWKCVPAVAIAGIALGSVRAEKSEFGAVLRDSGSGWGF